MFQQNSIFPQLKVIHHLIFVKRVFFPTEWWLFLISLSYFALLHSRHSEWASGLSFLSSIVIGKYFSQYKTSLRVNTPSSKLGLPVSPLASVFHSTCSHEIVFRQVLVGWAIITIPTPWHHQLRAPKTFISMNLWRKDSRVFLKWLLDFTWELIGYYKLRLFFWFLEV